MRFTTLLVCVAALAGCQSDAKKKSGNTEVHDAGADASDPAQPPPITAKRQETFKCNMGEDPAAMEPVPFTGSTIDQLVVREDANCQHTISHKRLDTGAETPLFTGAFSFGESALRNYDGSLLACTSQVSLSPPTGGGAMTEHTIQNVSIRCASNVGGTWSTVKLVAGPGYNEWAAWVSSVQPTGYPGQYEVKWVHDTTLFPFSFVDDGRPAEDGIYVTQITTSPSGITVGSTTKVSDSVLDQDSMMYRLPSGKQIPQNKSSKFAVDNPPLVNQP